MDLEKISNLFGADLAKQAYDDAVSPAAKEVGKTGGDLVKALRLFTAPLQLMAAWQDRLTAYLEKVRLSVPERNQIEAPASIAGPILERLKYLEEDNHLTALYLELLSRAIDKERIEEAHPAFLSIIEQLSPDEALIIYHLSDTWSDWEFGRPAWPDVNGELPWTPIKEPPFYSALHFKRHVFMYAEHLEALNVIDASFGGSRDEMINLETNDYRMCLTKFGELFKKACIPAGGLKL